MAIEVQLTGSLKAAENDILAAVADLAIRSGTVTQVRQGKREVAPNTTSSLDFGGITAARFIWIRGKNTSNNNDRSVLVTLNAVTNPKPSTEFIHCNSEDPSTTAITSAQVFNRSDGITCTVDYIVAG